MIATWTNATTARRNGLSLATIRDALPAPVVPTEGSLLDKGTGMLSSFIHDSVPALWDLGMPAITFVASLGVGTLTATGLVGFAWATTLEWHAYASFADTNRGGPLSSQRAAAFANGGSTGIVVGALVISAVAVACANGGFYDLQQINKKGLPPVWLTIGVCGSQAASAAV